MDHNTHARAMPAALAPKRDNTTGIFVKCWLPVIGCPVFVLVFLASPQGRRAPDGLRRGNPLPSRNEMQILNVKRLAGLRANL